MQLDQEKRSLYVQVKRREEAIKRLKLEHISLQENNSRYEEKVSPQYLLFSIEIYV